MEVFEQSGVTDLIESALEGFSCTVFAYGQTGAGKTHTMSGYGEMGEGVDELHGIIPRASRRLFQEAEGREGVSYTFKASYLEIYNEQVTDLLNPEVLPPKHESQAQTPIVIRIGHGKVSSLPVRWRRSGFFVENLFVVEMETIEDILAVFEEGSKNRSVRAHEMNVESSRSHAVLILYSIVYSISGSK